MACGHRWSTTGSLESLGYRPTPPKRITPELRKAIEASTSSAEDIAIAHGLRLAQVHRLIGREPPRPCQACVHWDEHYDLRCDLDLPEARESPRYGCAAFSPNTSLAHSR